MNKNNTSIPNSSEPSRSKSKNKDCEGRSEFTRHKLQREYQPKIIPHKHKLPKTTEQQRDAQLRIQREKEEELVAANALECFKKGEMINIDWKTKTNFRKSQISLKLPRLKTQTLDLKKTNPLNFKYNRSNTFQDRRAKSLKNKEIEQKRSRLKQLLYPKKTDRNSRIQISFTQNQQALYDNRSSILSESKSGQMLKGIVVNNKLHGQSQNLNSFLDQHKMISEKYKMLSFAYLRSNTQEMKNLPQFSDQFLQRSERDNHLNHKINTIQSYINESSSLVDNRSSKNRDSTPINRDESIQVGLPAPEKKKQEPKNQENYDILNDPEIYLLISKSRDRIISWKESCILDSMNHVDRLRFQQETANKSPANNQRREKERALSLQNSLLAKKVEKEKMIQKIEDRKRIHSEKLSKKLTTRVLTQTQEFLRQSSMRNSANHSKIYSYLGMKSPQSQQQKSQKLFRPKQSVIRQKKKSSLIQVQEKLLKRVKLSFLKQDLTKKFQQIRTEQNNSAMRPQ